jgi:hypothetical protein
VSPVEAKNLFGYLSKYGIDTNRFEHIHDQDLISRYPEIENWVFENDPRNDWLKQQALKMAALDYVNFDAALIHDPDTWLTEPYRCYNGKKLNMMVLKNTTEGSYDLVLPSVLGIERQTKHCFVTEFMPMLKKDWQSLKSTLEHRHNKNFLDATIENVPGIDTIDGTQKLKWFSEYEFLGNWTLTQRSVDFKFQKRFSFTDIEELDHIFPESVNSLCDQSSGQKLALGFDDWSDGKIHNYDRCMQLLRKHYTF